MGGATTHENEDGGADGAGQSQQGANDASAPAEDGGCRDGQARCGSTCTSTATDPYNCGRCNLLCPGGTMCRQGACSCPAGLTLCGTCVDPASDDRNCGHCGNACPSGSKCESGVCTCPAGLVLCGSKCVNPASDPNDCGGCGHACPVNATCVGGSCSCPAGWIQCGGACVDPRSDANNCGGCGIGCGGHSCLNGGCCAQQGTCSHSLCDTGPPLVAGCDSPAEWVQIICWGGQYDPHCCTNQWDADCVQRAMSIGYVCSGNC
jgi:hypothetical protein